MRNYLVKYTNICGEFEFSGVTVLILEPRQQIKAAVHAYFQHYYINFLSRHDASQGFCTVDASAGRWRGNVGKKVDRAGVRGNGL